MLIAVHDTDIDFNVFDVALTVGAVGVVRVTDVGICAVAGEVAEDDPPLFETVITT